MHFHFQADRDNGGQVHSRITADNFQDAHAKLKARGFTNVQLTQVDSPSQSQRESSPPPPPTFFTLGNLLALGLVIALVVGGTAYFLENREKSEGNHEEVAAQVLPRESYDTMAEPVQAIVFSPHVLRSRLHETLTGSVISDNDVENPAFADIGDISIRSSAEVGYDYVVVVEWLEWDNNTHLTGTRYRCLVEVFLKENYQTASGLVRYRGDWTRNKEEILDRIARVLSDLATRR